MHLVPAPAVRLMKRRVLSRPGLKSLMLVSGGRGLVNLIETRLFTIAGAGGYAEDAEPLVTISVS